MRFLGLLLAFVLVLPSLSLAATITWSGFTNTNWTLGANWIGGAVIMWRNIRKIREQNANQRPKRR